MFQVVISDVERYWLAGLLEGEATFQKGPPTRSGEPAIAVIMTDRDVVERVGRLWDRAVIAVRPRDSRHKFAYASRIRGAAAASWMSGLEPLLCRRRQGQIATALTGHSKMVRWRRPTGRCSTSNCDRPSAIRGLCTHHYKLWWKASRRGRSSRYVPVGPSPPIDDSVPIPPPSDREPVWIAWLAGLLEGEGTFANSGGYPVISAQMCDLDVLQRAAMILAIKRIAPKDVHRNELQGWSPSFYIACGGARAAQWMRLLHNSMGDRRRTEIDRALATCRPVRLTQVPSRCVVPGCERPHRSRGLCTAHYMKWDRDRKAGKPQRVAPLR